MVGVPVYSGGCICCLVSPCKWGLFSLFGFNVSFSRHGLEVLCNLSGERERERERERVELRTGSPE